MAKEQFKNQISWFEIPVGNMERAQTFYEQILEIKLSPFDLGPNHKMAIFPHNEKTIGGALSWSPENYFPGNKGPLIYLNANPDLQIFLDRINSVNGKILMPKTQISEENGFMAMFEDTEGNRLALHSNN